MKVAEILKGKGTRILTVRLDETVEVAARLMAAEKVGGLVVKDVVRTEGNTCVGMFTERDALRGLVERGPAVMRMPVEKLMSKTLISCGPEDELDDVVEKMDRHAIRHLPILEEHTLIGVVSVRDVIAVLRGRTGAAAA